MRIINYFHFLPYFDFLYHTLSVDSEEFGLIVKFHFFKNFHQASTEPTRKLLMLSILSDGS